MPIEDFLQKDERVLASCDEFRATDQRLIRYEKRRGKEQVRAIEYDQIASVLMVSRPRVQSIVMGLVVALLAVAIGPEGVAKPILIVVGLLGGFSGFLNVRIYLELNSDHLSPKEQHRWRIAGGRREEAQKLVALIQSPEARQPRIESPQQGVVAADLRTRRSVLLIPADRPEQVPLALNLSPDALCLDMVDLVPPWRRDLARQLVWGEITAASKSYSEVLVRIDRATAREDLGMCVWPGLSGVVVSVENADEVRQLAQTLSDLEAERRLPTSVRLLISLSTVSGLWTLGEMALTGSRVDAVVMDIGDLSLDTEWVPEEVTPFGATAPYFPGLESLWSHMVLVSAANRFQLLCFLGATDVVGQLDEAPEGNGTARFLASAQRARQAGFRGALTAHPQGVEACKAGFMSPEEALTWARETLEGGGGVGPLAASRLRVAHLLLREAQGIERGGLEEPQEPVPEALTLEADQLSSLEETSAQDEER